MTSARDALERLSEIAETVDAALRLLAFHAEGLHASGPRRGAGAGLP